MDHSFDGSRRTEFIEAIIFSPDEFYPINSRQCNLDSTSYRTEPNMGGRKGHLISYCGLEDLTRKVDALFHRRIHGRPFQTCDGRDDSDSKENQRRCPGDEDCADTVGTWASTQRSLFAGSYSSTLQSDLDYLCPTPSPEVLSRNLWTKCRVRKKIRSNLPKMDTTCNNDDYLREMLNGTIWKNSFGAGNQKDTRKQLQVISLPASLTASNRETEHRTETPDFLLSTKNTRNQSKPQVVMTKASKDGGFRRLGRKAKRWCKLRVRGRSRKSNIA